jgi:hypothetical protein
MRAIVRVTAPSRDICQTRQSVGASWIDGVAGSAVPRQVEGDEPVLASERTLDLMAKHFKTRGIAVDQENRKLSMTGLLDPNESMRCAKRASFSGFDLLHAHLPSSTAPNWTPTARSPLL